MQDTRTAVAAEVLAMTDGANVTLRRALQGIRQARSFREVQAASDLALAAERTWTACAWAFSEAELVGGRR